MNSEKRDFNKEAATWDEPRRARMAGDIADAIIAMVSPGPGTKAIDFGCGTGLLTLRLQPHVTSITGVDSSRGMLDALEVKIKNNKLHNVKTLFLDPDNGDKLTGKYDLITSSMALHHIQNVSQLLDQFFQITSPGGHLCIADLDPEGGLFHAENHNGVFHDGFDRAELRNAFTSAGYTDVSDQTATTVIKPVPGGTMSFTIFMMTGYKSK